MDHPSDHAGVCAPAAQSGGGTQLAVAHLPVSVAWTFLLLVDRQAFRPATAHRASGKSLANDPFGADRRPGEHVRSTGRASAALDGAGNARLQPRVFPAA